MSLKRLVLITSFVFAVNTLGLHSSIAQEYSVLVEAESFSDHGGWSLDTQFINEMGSPYLLAHGLGQPVKNASTMVKFPATGKYKIYLRTKDWVARWKAPGTPGRFKLIVGESEVEKEFGTEGTQWHWQFGGNVEIENVNTKLEFKDLTGFDGRVDAIYFTTEAADRPPNDKSLANWRSEKLGLPATPKKLADYDLVVVGGGYSGMGTALSASRMGCRVALIQNRGVLGGNGSSEVRVWAQGLVRRGKYPRIGEIIEEFADKAKKSPGTYEEFGDSQKEALIRAEKNIDLFLNHHAFAVTRTENQIKSVLAFDTKTSEQKEFFAPLFADCTGHGTIGFMAKAKFNMTDNGRMGMSNMWAWANAVQPTAFPETPWALDLDMKDFPYPRDFHGQWFWESGFDKDPLGDAEGIRDWNLRAVYGAFNAMKNRDGAAKHRNAILTWLAFIGGPRESRRLVGDVILTEDDIVSKREFPDGCVPSTWSIDLHYPKEQFSKKYPDNPFISKAVHGEGVDRTFGYPVPYRCFYSANIDNLFMAGRCASVTHEALGTVRVMKTCGMMGEVVGKAASICVQKECKPRDVYQKYWGDMGQLLQLPGAARRQNVNAAMIIPDNIPKLINGIPTESLDGTVIDDLAATITGQWGTGQSLEGFIGRQYVYSAASDSNKIEFKVPIAKDGAYDVRISWRAHENRATNAPVTVRTTAGEKRLTINMKKDPSINGIFESLGQFELKQNTTCSIVVSAKNVNGYVCVDAVQLLPVKK